MRHIRIRGLVFACLFAALLSVSSLLNVTLGFTPVPISLENLVIMLAGALLGPWYGLLSVLLTVVLATLGLPLFHGSGGAGLMLGPTGGFVWMYPLSTLLIGLTTSRGRPMGIGSFILTFLSFEIFGSLLLYVTGVPWLAHVAHVSFAKALMLGCYPYLPGDAVKAFLAAWVIMPIRQVYPASRILYGSAGQVVKLDADTR
jgi:biotin transport system substrate-specific component